MGLEDLPEISGVVTELSRPIEIAERAKITLRKSDGTTERREVFVIGIAERDNLGVDEFEYEVIHGKKLSQGKYLVYLTRDGDPKIRASILTSVIHYRKR
ncbi:MAG: hypothetical protein AABW58_00715 [Nanoarchaeota archaeon]